MRKNLYSFLIIPILFTFVLCFSMESSFAVSGVSSSTQLSSSGISLDIGTKKSIKLKKAPGKVKWSSSNKEVASVSAKRGKNGAVITVKAKKHGKCTITAVSGGKKYRCKVTVSKLVIKPISSSASEQSLKYKYDRKLGVNGTRTFNTAVSDFSFKLLGELCDKGSDSSKNNLLISPASVVTALAMVENGAKGKTLKEMRSTISGDISAKDFNAYLAGFNGRLCASKKAVYQQSNSLWLSKSHPLHVRKSYLKKNKQYHNAQVFKAPFNARTVKDINNWVYNNSRNMIDSIIDRLSSDDRMVAVNVTAFEGSWTDPFGSPHKDDFTSYDGSVNKVRMLSDTGYYRYIRLKGGKGFVKYYVGDDKNHSIAFVGIVPPEGEDIDQFVSDISGKAWIKAWKSSEVKNIRIKLPQFKYDYSASLKASLYSMGIRNAFTDSADFSGICTEGKSIHIDDVLHKTHIELDKNGTKAAAATAVVMKANSIIQEKPEEVFLNRPFMYAIVDAKTGIPLFAGIIYDPR